MINWNDIEFNKQLSVTILDNNIKYYLKIVLVEYEYSLHRHPMIAHLNVIESNNIEEYPINSIMRLPIETKDEINFLLFTPTDKLPNRELNRKGILILNNIK